MPLSLEALETLVHGVVRDEVPVADAAATLGVDPHRLGIYRHFVRGHVRTALAANFPLLETWIGPERWDALVEAYRTDCPPSHWGLNQAAERFTAWLADRIEAGQTDLTAAHQALAELEWALFELQADPTQIPEAAALNGPVLNPTLMVLSFPYAVVPLALALTDDQIPEPPTPDESMVLVYRRPGTEASTYHTALPELLFAIKVLHDGLTIADAAAASGHPESVIEAVLAQAAAAGVVIQPG